MILASSIILLSILNRCLAYSSVETVRKAYVVDQSVVATLQKHLEIIEDYKTIVHEYVEEHNRMLLEQQDEDLIVKNPLNAYQIIRRVVLNRKRIVNYMNDIALELVGQLEKEGATIGFSFNEHLLEASEGLLRLQETYLLHPQHLTAGKIRHINSTGRLTVSDCLLLADSSANMYRLDFQVQWLQQAHRACMAQMTSSKVVCEYTTQPMYEAAKLKHDETRQWLFDHGNHPIDDEGHFKIVLPNSTSAMDPLSQRTSQIQDEMFSNNDIESFLCYKGSVLEAKEMSKLTCCYLNRHDDVYVTLKRYRVEVRSLRPLVLTIYDVISSSEVELMKQLARPKLKRSIVLAEDTSRVVSKNRVSETAWLKDGEHPVLSTISRRIASITGLNVDETTTEDYQVVNYGIGGLYRAHYDFFQSEDMDKPMEDGSDDDDRLATFMLYLNDVELGGATVFPNALVSVPPRKGAATFWYNLNETGHPDMNTRHGGCPVLYGSKWIANKWIHVDGQMFIKKCPTRLP